jgi:heme-degrading monooxygenase HmoA
MVVDLVTFRVKRGKQQEFEKHSEEWLGALRRTRGFIAQVLMRSTEDPTEYHAEVRWVNRDYRDRFSAQEDGGVKALAQKSSALLEEPPVHRLLEYV